jgi:hypothetical protein
MTVGGKGSMKTTHSVESQAERAGRAERAEALVPEIVEAIRAAGGTNAAARAALAVVEARVCAPLRAELTAAAARAQKAESQLQGFMIRPPGTSWALSVARLEAERDAARGRVAELEASILLRSY